MYRSFCVLLRVRCACGFAYMYFRFSILITSKSFQHTENTMWHGRAFVSAEVYLPSFWAIIFVASSLRWIERVRNECWKINVSTGRKGYDQSMINVSFYLKCDAVTGAWAHTECIAKYCFCLSFHASQHLSLCVRARERALHLHVGTVTLTQCRCERNFKHHLLDYMTEIQCGKMCEMIDSIHFTSAHETNDTKATAKEEM